MLAEPAGGHASRHSGNFEETLALAFYCGLGVPCQFLGRGSQLYKPLLAQGNAFPTVALRE